MKAGNSFEVQMDFEKGATQATKVEVANNMWCAQGTERTMKNEKHMPTTALAADPQKPL